MDKTFKGLTGNSRLVEAKKFERQLITSQSNEYMKGFSFWPMPDNRKGPNIYDVRSYELKPGKYRRYMGGISEWGAGAQNFRSLVHQRYT